MPYVKPEETPNCGSRSFFAHIRARAPTMMLLAQHAYESFGGVSELKPSLTAESAGGGGRLHGRADQLQLPQFAVDVVSNRFKTSAGA